MMLALGIAVDISSSGRPVARAVLLKDGLPRSSAPSLAAVQLMDSFEVVASSSDLAEQAWELNKAIEGRVASLNPDVVVVRRADFPPRPSNQDGPRIRLMSEGAITAAARSLVQATTVRTGKECGRAYGASKAQLEVDAGALAAKRALLPAATAALSGLFGDR